MLSDEEDLELELDLIEGVGLLIHLGRRGEGGLRLCGMCSCPGAGVILTSTVEQEHSLWESQELVFFFFLFDLLRKQMSIFLLQNVNPITKNSLLMLRQEKKITNVLFLFFFNHFHFNRINR